MGDPDPASQLAFARSFKHGMAPAVRATSKPRMCSRTPTPIPLFWRFGVWRFGVLAFWRFGVLAFWRFGVLAFWRFGG